MNRLEVWVTNRQNRVSTTNNNLRNIIALQDLGEAQLNEHPNNADIVAIQNPPADFFTTPLPPPTPAQNLPSDNRNNRYDPALIGAGGIIKC